MRWIGRPKTASAPLALRAPRIPEGKTVFAIGDVHGRADLLTDLILMIWKEEAASPDEKIIVMLGDYIDRGPNSSEVIELLTRLTRLQAPSLVLLKGNHDQALLDFLNDAQNGPGWVQHGGRETLMSYGILPPSRGGDEEAWEAAREAFARTLPKHHLALLQGLRPLAVIGDYVFVHAGLRPKVALEDQVERDLLWIRAEFLNAPPWGEQMIVHGHTPELAPVETTARIGVDTGAYATGVLTAVRLKDDDRRFLRTTS